MAEKTLLTAGVEEPQPERKPVAIEYDERIEDDTDVPYMGLSVYLAYIERARAGEPFDYRHVAYDAGLDYHQAQLWLTRLREKGYLPPSEAA
jgi:hypothetical protein